MGQTASHKKLLLVGPTTGSVHLRNFYHLVKDYFDEILVLTESKIDYCQHQIVDFTIRKPWKIGSNIKRIQRHIEAFDPAIIHVHQANSCLYFTTRANKKQYPLVVSAWGSDVLILPNKGFWMKKMVQSGLRSADVITADAKYMIEAIDRLAPKSETVLANFGIEYQNVEIPEKENIIYSNRLHKPLYNVDQIIKAFKPFYEAHPEWKLVLAATGSETEALKNLANEHLPQAAYEFVGFVADEVNRAFYLKSKIWTSVPSSDGTAISLLEAMGYGCIPVVSDLPANREWINEGENGFIVTENLNEVWTKASQADLKKIQEINRQIVIEKATKKANQKIFVGIYESLSRK